MSRRHHVRTLGAQWCTLAKLGTEHGPHFSWFAWMPILSKGHPGKRTLMDKARLLEPIDPARRVKQRIDDHSLPRFKRGQAGAHKSLRDKFA